MRGTGDGCQTFVIGHIRSRNLKSQAPVCSTLRILIVYRVCACKQQIKGLQYNTTCAYQLSAPPTGCSMTKMLLQQLFPMDHKTANVNEVIILVLSSQDLAEWKKKKTTSALRNRNVAETLSTGSNKALRWIMYQEYTYKGGITLSIECIYLKTCLYWPVSLFEVHHWWACSCDDMQIVCAPQWRDVFLASRDETSLIMSRWILTWCVMLLMCINVCGKKIHE